MRRPWASALAASAVLLAWRCRRCRWCWATACCASSNPTHEIRGGVGAAAEALGPGALGPVQVLVTFPDGDASAPANHRRSARSPPVEQAPQHHLGVSAGLRQRQQQRPAVGGAVGGSRGHGRARNRRLDAHALPRRARTAAARVDVGGPTALIKDFDDRVSRPSRWCLVFVALIAFVMLLMSIQSVFLAFKGVLMTMLSVAAAYGSLVVVFQWGWLEKLGFAPITSIDSTVPPLVLAMTFGLSMDYEIFLLTRIRERFLQTGNTHDAVAYGVSTSARTITSAALIMIAVFIGFAFAGMPLVAEIGVACAVAIAVDATMVRLVMVPP